MGGPGPGWWDRLDILGVPQVVVVRPDGQIQTHQAPLPSEGLFSPMRRWQKRQGRAAREPRVKQRVQHLLDARERVVQGGLGERRLQPRHVGDAFDGLGFTWVASPLWVMGYQNVVFKCTTPPAS